MKQPPVITLLTDFGLSDPYVGIMKGIIADITPGATVIDLTHLIPPQDIWEGALALERAYEYFPTGTIHLAVIDPGVGSNRHAIVLQADNYLFVGPDNGLFTFIIKKARLNDKPVKAYRLDNPRYRLEPVSPVFHGRDLFAPAAAYLAAGASPQEFGEEVANPLELSISEPEPTGQGWMGEVWSMDHFGSLETNLNSELLLGCNPKRVKIIVAGKVINRWVNTFSDATQDELIALLNSAGRLSISVVNGNAAKTLKAGVGTPVELILHT